MKTLKKFTNYFSQKIIGNINITNRQGKEITNLNFEFSYLTLYSLVIIISFLLFGICKILL